MGCCCSRIKNSDAKTVAIKGVKNSAFVDSYFKKVDGHALKAKRNDEVSLDALAHYLGTKFDTQLEKARAVYTWICHNISYDVESYGKGTIPSQKGGDVLHSRSSVCAGYSNLFKELLDRMGVECQIISGFSKGIGWTGKAPDSPNHGWNAVKIDGLWYLVDSTWGAGSTNETRQFVKKFTNFYFLCPEDMFFYRHYPSKPSWLPNAWRNKSPQLGLEDWNNLIRFEEKFHTLGLSHFNFSTFECFDQTSTSDPTLEIVFQKTSQNTKPISFMSKFYDETGKEINNAILVVDRQTRVQVLIAFPAKGAYKLELFGKFAENQEALGRMMTFNLHHTGSGTQNTFPIFYDSFFRILATDQDDFDAQGYLRNFTTSDDTMHIVFPKGSKASKPLFFIGDLHDKNGKEISNSTLVVDKDDKVEISVIFPAKGAYKLTVFGKVLGDKKGSLLQLVSLNLNHTGSGTQNTFPIFYDSFFRILATDQDDFDAKGYLRNFTTPDDTMHIAFPKGSKASKPLSFVGDLHDKNGKEISNSTLVVDKADKVGISVIFPAKGAYQLNLFGKVLGDKKGSLLQLFSLNLNYTGNGTHKMFPTLYSDFHGRRGTSIICPRYGPLKDMENIETQKVEFECDLPEAIDAVILPGWHHLCKNQGTDFRWQGEFKLETGSAKLGVKYKKSSNSYATIAEW